MLRAKNFKYIIPLCFLILAVVTSGGSLENTYPNGQSPRGIQNLNFFINILEPIAGSRTFSYLMFFCFVMFTIPWWNSRPSAVSREASTKKPKNFRVKKPKSKLSQPDQEFVNSMFEELTAQLAHINNLERLQQDQPFHIRLIPQIPIQSQSTNWLGGNPHMLESIEWPMGNDTLPMQFIAQIDLTTIPVDLWEGLGPRKGWLLFFLGYDEPTIKVIHSHTLGPARLSPPIPTSRSSKYAHWFYSGPDKYDDIPSAIRAHPHWPVNIFTVQAGTNSENWNYGYTLSTDENPSPNAQLFDEDYDIREPRFVPFDWHSLWCLIRATRYPIKYGKKRQQRQIPFSEKQIANLATKQPQNFQSKISKEREKIAAARVNINTLSQTEATITTLENAMIEAGRSQKPFTLELRDHYLSLITQLAMPGCTTQNKSNPDYLSYISSAKSGSWHGTYVALLLDYAKHLYATSPQSLPAALWQELYQHLHHHGQREFGLSGHYPASYVHEFNANSEITILQLPSSHLMKWMWGDVYDLVLTIPKSDLGRNDFSRVKLQITN